MLCDICTSLHFKPFRLLSPEHQQFISTSFSSDEQGYEDPHTGFFFHHRDVSNLRQSVDAKQCDLCPMVLSIVDSSQKPQEDLWGNNNNENSEEEEEHKNEEEPPAPARDPEPIWFFTQSLAEDGSWNPEPNGPIHVARGTTVVYPRALWTLDIPGLPDELSDCTDVSMATNVEVEDEGRIMQRSLKLANWWVTQCRRTHEHCRQVNDIPLWPTRLIDVDSTEPRLVKMDRAGGGKSGGYATLSHCWGKAPLITTTKATLSDREAGIPVSSLPKTFRDAITVCRGLGIPYLWIDALCIIQDSEEDWVQEARNMGTVYKEAAVCISAVGSSDGSGGLFFPETRPGLPNGLSHTLCRTKLSFPPLATVADEESDTDAPDRPVYIGVRHGVVVSGPLRTRAWVLQEEKLSRRQLEFTDSGLHWTCQTVHAHAANIFGSAFGRNEFWDQFDVAVDEDGGFAGLFVHDEERQTYDFWYRSVVEDYTRRGITYSSDRVVALAALTTQFDRALWLGIPDDRALRLERLAGLWSTDMPCGLLWTPVNEDTVRVRPPAVPYLGPSWSWMSVRGPVSYREAVQRRPRDTANVCVEIVKAECAALDGTIYSPTGFVSGELELRGKLRSFTYWRRCWKVDIPGVGLVQFKEDHDLAVDDDETVLGVAAMDDLRDLPEDYKLFAVPLVRRPATNEEEESFFCLILKPATGTPPFTGGFLRVGHMILIKLDFFKNVAVSPITIY